MAKKSNWLLDVLSEHGVGKMIKQRDVKNTKAGKKAESTLKKNKK